MKNKCGHKHRKYSTKWLQISFVNLDEDFLGYAIANEILREFSIYLIEK